MIGTMFPVHVDNRSHFNLQCSFSMLSFVFVCVSASLRQLQGKMSFKEFGIVLLYVFDCFWMFQLGKILQ